MKRRTINADEFGNSLVMATVRAQKEMEGAMDRMKTGPVPMVVICDKVGVHSRSGLADTIMLTIVVLKRGPDGWSGDENDVSIDTSEPEGSLWNKANSLVEQVEKEIYYKAGIPMEQISDHLVDYWLQHDPKSWTAYFYLSNLSNHLVLGEINTKGKSWDDFTSYLGAGQTVMAWTMVMLLN